LNADWLGELVAELEGRGYRWIALDEALEDPVYERAIDGWTGRLGLSWLHRWAISGGLDPSALEGEPEPSAWVERVPRP